MSPAYEREGQWYFVILGYEEGPFDNQQEANAAWRAAVLEANKCSTGTCED